MDPIAQKLLLPKTWSIILQHALQPLLEGENRAGNNAKTYEEVGTSSLQMAARTVGGR